MGVSFLFCIYCVLCFNVLCHNILVPFTFVDAYFRHQHPDPFPVVLLHTWPMPCYVYPQLHMLLCGSLLCIIITLVGGLLHGKRPYPPCSALLICTVVQQKMLIHTAAAIHLFQMTLTSLLSVYVYLNMLQFQYSTDRLLFKSHWMLTGTFFFSPLVIFLRFCLIIIA